MQYTVNDYSKQKAAYECAVENGAMLKAKAIRNDITWGVMIQIEILYASKYQRLFNGKNMVGIFGDFTTLGLSAGSTIATHVATKTLLAALGTGIAGLNLSIEKNYYSEQSFQVIGIAMQTRRDKIRAVLISNLDQDASKYPLNAARRDLMAYLQAGTLASGLQELQEEAGAATAATKTATVKPLEAPLSVIANPGIGQDAITWSAVSGASFYNVYWGTNPGLTKTSSKLGSYQDTFASHSGLDSTNYYYAVTAVNELGESPFSTEVPAKPLGEGTRAPDTGLLAPSNLTATTVGSGITLTWTAPRGATNFNVYRGTEAPLTISSTKIWSGKYNSYADADVKVGQQVFYAVEAVPESGPGKLSDTLSVSRKATATPSQPPKYTAH